MRTTTTKKSDRKKYIYTAIIILSGILFSIAVFLTKTKNKKRIIYTEETLKALPFDKQQLVLNQLKQDLSEYIKMASVLVARQKLLEQETFTMDDAVKRKHKTFLNKLDAIKTTQMSDNKSQTIKTFEKNQVVAGVMYYQNEINKYLMGIDTLNMNIMNVLQKLKVEMKRADSLVEKGKYNPLRRKNSKFDKQG